jgi:hypothetical protein
MNSIRPKKNRIYLSKTYIHKEDFYRDAIKYNERFLDELSEYDIHDKMIPRIVEIIENYRAKLNNPNLEI